MALALGPKVVLGPVRPRAVLVSQMVDSSSARFRDSMRTFKVERGLFRKSGRTVGESIVVLVVDVRKPRCAWAGKKNWGPNARGRPLCHHEGTACERTYTVTLGCQVELEKITFTLDAFH